MEEIYALGYGKRPTAIVRFLLSGDDLDPKIITRALGVQPQESWSKGDKVTPDSRIRLTSRPDRAFGRWALSPDNTPYDDPETQIERLLSLLEELPESLHLLTERYKGEIKVGISSGDASIGIHLPLSLIKRLVLIGVSVDFDIYPIANEDSD
jgi:hypothetical protein